MQSILRRLRLLLRPQFSLRGALLLMGLIGIALAIWRWPWEEESTTGPFPELVAPPGYNSMHAQIARTRQQMRRGWWGEKLKSGPAESFDQRGRLVARQQWYDGHLHGPEIWFDLAGNPIVEQTRARGKLNGPFRYGDGFRWRFRGTYMNEKRHGQCSDDEEWLSGLTIERVGQWANGRLDGVCQWQVADSGEVLNRGVFKNGALVEWNGEPARNHLQLLANRGEIKDPTFDVMLRDDNADKLPYSVYEIDGAVVRFGDSQSVDHKGTLQVDPTLRFNFIPQQLGTHPGVLKTPAASDELLGSLIPWGMTIDLRYGQLWIVPLEDAGEWKDPTGVNQIMPVQNSKLADAWNSPHLYLIVVDSNNAALLDPLQELFNWWPEETEVVLDVATHFPKLHERWTKTESRKNRDPANVTAPTLHDWLGMRLYQAGLQCELQGNRVVILPHWSSRFRLPSGI